MSESFKICPICQSRNHPRAVLCVNCGTSLGDVQAVATQLQATPTPLSDYDFHYGEADLMESVLTRAGRRFTLGIIVFISVATLVSVIAVLAPNIVNNLQDVAAMLEPPPTRTPTPRPTIFLPTVTPAPPTEIPSNTPIPTPTNTPTPTREPCLQPVVSGSTLYELASRCGHLSFDILPVIVEINGLSDANSLVIGQTLEIPWPTATPDPNAVPEQAPADAPEAQGASADGEESGVEQVSAFDENFDPSFIPTPTLPPGVQFHTISFGENMLIIADTYGASVEVLSQLNPEITFSQCDFGLFYGGPRCTVNLFENQLIRVPAPTPTPTLVPTLTGFETATPTATATFNAPSIQSPSDRANFLRDQLVTLRWNPSGTLSPGQTYLVRVEDLTAGIVYITTTPDTSIVLPEEWQATGIDRHEYRWQISVIFNDDPDNPTFTTASRTFTWEGNGLAATDEAAN